MIGDIVLDIAEGEVSVNGLVAQQNLDLFKILHDMKKNNMDLSKLEEKLNKSITQQFYFKDVIQFFRQPFIYQKVSNIDEFCNAIAQNNITFITKEEIIEYIGFSKTSAQNAIEILENLLDWVKTQARTISINPTETNIYNLISETVDKLQTSLISKNINLSINIKDDLVASLDQNMTFVIIRNILTNAIKFTHNNGEINIEAKKINSKLLISISDNGIGMDKEKLKGLFDIKDAKSTPGTNKEKGIGIGLILCKELTESQGGTIWAESTLHKGSSFFIKI